MPEEALICMESKSNNLKFIFCKVDRVIFCKDDLVGGETSLDIDWCCLEDFICYIAFFL